MVEVLCDMCKEVLLKQPYQVKKQSKFFCSKVCLGLSRTVAAKSQGSRDNDFICRRCKVLKPGIDFRWQLHLMKDGSYKDYRSHCRECLAASKSLWHEGHKEEQADAHRKWQKEQFESDDEKALLHLFNRRMASYRRRASLKGLMCNLTPKFLVELFKKQEGKCYYSGILLDWNNFGIGKNKKNLNGLSVDRVDPTKGYTQDNVVLCTYGINSAKSTMTLDQFYESCSLALEVKKARENIQLDL